MEAPSVERHREHVSTLFMQRLPWFFSQSQYMGVSVSREARAALLLCRGSTPSTTGDEIMDITENQLRILLAANVRRLRQEQGLSQDDLAARIGCSRVQINRVENGHRTPGADLLFGLADALDVSTDELRQPLQELSAKSA